MMYSTATTEDGLPLLEQNYMELTRVKPAQDQKVVWKEVMHRASKLGVKVTPEFIRKVVDEHNSCVNEEDIATAKTMLNILVNDLASVKECSIDKARWIVIHAMGDLEGEWQ
jgi:3-methyladenine DNA glycosylase AlkC